MRFTQIEHCGGISKVPVAQRAEAELALTACAVVPQLRAAPRIRDAIIGSLVQSGWSGEVAVSTGSNITITSSRNNIGLCLQTGNISRIYADLLKLQKLFLDGGIKAGLLIVPTSGAAMKLGSNIANCTRLARELTIFRKVIHMPLVIYAFE